jgi:hypothetical protein
MKIIIQHNWTTGLGDLFCGSTEYLNFIKQYKDLGYETKLIFSYNGVTGNKFIGVNPFEDIFDVESFNLFDSIEVASISNFSKEIDGCTFRHSQYMNSPRPGHHWWDVFSDVELIHTNYPNYSPTSFLFEKKEPEIFPKFNDNVYKKLKEFKTITSEDYDYIQIRYYDYAEITENFKEDISKIYELIKNSDRIFHLGSNNQYALDTLSVLENVFTYRFSNLDLFSNDHSYYFYNKHIPNKILLERLYENIAEMCTVKNANKIYMYNSHSWISNFLYYGFTQREKELKFYNINNNLNLLSE